MTALFGRSAEALRRFAPTATPGTSAHTTALAILIFGINIYLWSVQEGSKGNVVGYGRKETRGACGVCAHRRKQQVVGTFEYWTAARYWAVPWAFSRPLLMSSLGHGRMRLARHEDTHTVSHNQCRPCCGRLQLCMPVLPGHPLTLFGAGGCPWILFLFQISTFWVHNTRHVCHRRRVAAANIACCAEQQTKQSMVGTGRV